MIRDHCVNIMTIVCSVLCAAVQHGELAHRGARHVRILRPQRSGVRTLLLLRRLRDQGQDFLGDTEDTEQQQQEVNRPLLAGNSCSHIDDVGAAVAPLAAACCREGRSWPGSEHALPYYILPQSSRNLNIVAVGNIVLRKNINSAENSGIYHQRP